MPNDVNAPGRRGYYAGATAISPVGLGGGLYADFDGNFYPQIAIGTPGYSGSFGEATDLDKFLTGASITASGGGIGIGYNPESAAAEVTIGRPLARAPQTKIGTPGLTATYGFGPLNIRKLPSLLYSDGGPDFEPTYPLP